MKKIIMGAALLIIGAHMHGMEQQKGTKNTDASTKGAHPRRKSTSVCLEGSPVVRTRKIGAEDIVKFNESLQTKEEKK